jgi:transcriptional antiterminator RfaH
MPLLPLEPFVFPENLLTGSPVAESEAEHWWVLHTRPRAEKALARLVLGHKLPFFLPLYKRQWRSRGRMLSSYLPLFPGYLFLRGDRQARQRALETNLVANCLSVGEQSRLTADLKNVFSLMASGSPLSPEERLQPGTHVEIVSGPLTGVEGKIIRRGKRLTFFVEVQFLQQGVSVEIESWMFRPLEAPRPAEAIR